MAKKSDIDKLRDSMRKDWNKSVKEMADKMSYQIEQSYHKVIDDFYNDAVFPYNTPPNRPISYSRGLHLVEASNGFPNGQNPWNIQQFGDSYFAGIQVDASNIPGNPYKAHKGWVFDRAYYSGIHGFSRNDVMAWNKKRGRGYHTEILKYSHTPLVSKNKPAKMMEKEFKELTKKKNMDRMFEEIVQKRFAKYN